MDPGAPQPLSRTLNRRDWATLLALWLACLALDLVWIHQHQAPPAWDQGEHLSRAIGFSTLLRQPVLWSSQWWHQLWAEAPSYRGPLTYMLSAPVLYLLGPSFRSAMASNAIANGLLIVSCYGLGRPVYGALVLQGWHRPCSTNAPITSSTSTSQPYSQGAGGCSVSGVGRCKELAGVGRG